MASLGVIAPMPDWQIGKYGPPSPITTPLQAFEYIEGRNRVIRDSRRQRPLIRLADKNMKIVGRIAAERSVDWEEMMYAAGEANVTLSRNDWICDFMLHDVRAGEDLHLLIDPDPTDMHNFRKRWGGKVQQVDIKRTAEGVHEVELKCISNRKHWEHLYFAANPLFPPEFQLPKAWILPANTRTGTCFTGVANLARQYEPLLALPANLLNPGHWLTTEIKSINPMAWPVQMQFVNPLLDQSRFNFITARWTDADTVTKPMHKDAGCFIRAYTWLPDDDESPHPELAALVGDRLSRPTRACVVLACEDKSGAGGPTGTLADGILNLVAQTLDDGITETLFPVDADHDGETDPMFRKWLMTAPKPPKVVFRDGQYTALVDAVRSIHKFKARTIIVGGKSPGWLNQAQTFAIRYALSQLATVISYGIGAYQQAGTEGLDNLYQGQLDDTAFAFLRFTDPRRVFQMGPYAFLEHKEDGSGSAYTVSGVASTRVGHWKTRSYTSFKASVMSGFPHTVFTDIELGDRTAFELEKILHTDQITSIKGFYDASTALKYDVAVGGDEEAEDPVARALRTAQAIWGVVGMVLGDGGSTF